MTIAEIFNTPGKLLQNGGSRPHYGVTPLFFNHSSIGSIHCSIDTALTLTLNAKRALEKYNLLMVCSYCLTHETDIGD